MTRHDAASLGPRTLMELQRESYAENGFLLLEGFIGETWLSRLRATILQTIDDRVHLGHLAGEQSHDGTAAPTAPQPPGRAFFSGGFTAENATVSGSGPDEANAPE